MDRDMQAERAAGRLNHTDRRRLVLVRALGEAAERCGLHAFRVRIAPDTNIARHARQAHVDLCGRWLRVIKHCTGPARAIAWVRAVAPDPETDTAVWEMVIWAANEAFAQASIRHCFEGCAVTCTPRLASPIDTAEDLVRATANEADRGWGRRWRIRRFQVGGKAAVGLLPDHAPAFDLAPGRQGLPL